MKDDSGRSISVCLLTYNHAHLIESTLASIQQQSLTDYEIIVSDDNSTDDSWAIIQRCAATDSRIRPVRPSKNLGMAGNANFAAAQSDRPYIALLHHDDLCRVDLLEKWLDVIKKYADVGFVFNPYGVEGSDFVWRETMPGEVIDGRWLLKHYLFPRWGCVVRGTAMIRRSAWTDVGGMRPEFGLLADVDLWMRLAMRRSVGYVNEPILILRQERPVDYPEEYQSNGWSWSRQRFLYKIHAANRRDYYDMHSFGGSLRWQLFRLRLSIETAKWLTYAVLRKKPEMIAQSDVSTTDYDIGPLRLYRSILLRLYSTKKRNS